MCTEVQDINMPLNYTNTTCTSCPSKNIKSFINHDKKKLLSLISRLLEDLIFLEDKRMEKSQYKMFDMDYTIDLPIKDYLARIDHHLKLDEEIYFAALIYIDRILESKSFFINKYNVYNLLSSSLLISSKFYNDSMYNNAVFAIVGGVSNEELNKFEVAFLNDIEYCLFIDKFVFKNYINRFFSYFYNGESNENN